MPHLPAKTAMYVSVNIIVLPVYSTQMPHVECVVILLAGCVNLGSWEFLQNRGLLIGM